MDEWFGEGFREWFKAISISSIFMTLLYKTVSPKAHFTCNLQIPLQFSFYMSGYALESPVPPADLIALSPGYRVPPDLATVPYAPWHTRFALMEAAMSDRMFEMTLSAP